MLMISNISHNMVILKEDLIGLIPKLSCLSRKTKSILSIIGLWNNVNYLKMKRFQPKTYNLRMTMTYIELTIRNKAFEKFKKLKNRINGNILASFLSYTITSLLKHKFHYKMHRKSCHLTITFNYSNVIILLKIKGFNVNTCPNVYSKNIYII